jgi:hypothetical protein
MAEDASMCSLLCFCRLLQQKAAEMDRLKERLLKADG